MCLHCNTSIKMWDGVASWATGAQKKNPFDTFVTLSCRRGGLDWFVVCSFVLVNTVHTVLLSLS